MASSEGTVESRQSQEQGLTYHVGVGVVNERFLEPVVEHDEDRVGQVASVTDAGGESPEPARKQPGHQTCREPTARFTEPRAPLRLRGAIPGPDCVNVF